ncbi:hypothetical protein [Amycolatopsis anabasis]|uniref:hypothetical protein n=1 Tax=Amycolatopsis anabasis TaxID=1840409 RepID=UPI00131A75E0|nr:hypothetical protein [Amycolatopsis anabasis]
MTGNEKKFRALVEDFVTTTADLGGTIDPEVVATELHERIRAIAVQLGVTEATVLRNYMPDDWGRDMARQTYRQIQERDAHIDAEPDQELPLHAVGRLIAALGQAQLYYTVNDGANDPTCRFNAKEASEAVTGLGLALTSPPADSLMVTVGGNILAWTQSALSVFRDNLQQQHWTSCPCGEDCGQQQRDAAVLRAVRDDLTLLPETTLA